MNEAQQIHTDLLRALLPIIPRTTYQDIRRLNTLVWASAWHIRCASQPGPKC